MNALAAPGTLPWNGKGLVSKATRAVRVLATAGSGSEDWDIFGASTWGSRAQAVSAIAAAAKVASRRKLNNALATWSAPRLQSLAPTEHAGAKTPKSR